MSISIEDMKPKLKYLVIEDSLNVCKGIKERVADFSIWECCSYAHHVDEAIAIINNDHPSLIFIDWSLKGGSAFEVLRHIDNSRNYDPYIIFNTGYQSENPEIPQEIINTYKIDKYLIKPIWENLRLNLPKYLWEAEQKAKNNPEKNELWFVDITKKRHHIDLQDLICIINHHDNPYYKVLYFTSQEALILKTSWEKLIKILTEYKINFFITNSRAHIVTKNYMQCYERPFVRMNNKLKIEVVREKLSQFERWIEV